MVKKEQLLFNFIIDSINRMDSSQASLNLTKDNYGEIIRRADRRTDKLY